MFQYMLKRLLMLPFTFFLISMVVFFLLNLAPTAPPEAKEKAGSGSEGAESIRIFRQQFNLDKPILLNTRQWLDVSDVRAWLGAIGSDNDADRIAAAEALADVGNDLVPHLVVLLDDPEVGPLALAQLPEAAKLAFVPDYYGTPEEVRVRNREVDRYNQSVVTLVPEGTAPADQIAAWKAWYAENQQTYVLSGGLPLVADLLLDTRFANYWAKLIHLDFGRSVIDGQPVWPKIVSKLRYSISLGFMSIILAYLVAVPLGIFSAVRRDTPADNVLTVALFMLYSLPTFFTGAVLLRWLSQGDPVAWFPTGGFASVDRIERTALMELVDIGWHLVLPILTYTSVTLAALSRYARAGVIEVIRSDYVRTARAKGLSEPVVILKHAARNGMIPILTLLGGLLPMLVSGSVVIEVVFGIPGMGSYLYEGISFRDYNAVMGVLLMSSLLTLIGIFLSDLSYALVDPRISFD